MNSRGKFPETNKGFKRKSAFCEEKTMKLSNELENQGRTCRTREKVDNL